MDIAKRLDFDPTGPLDIVGEARQAVEELQKAVQDLSATTSQKHGQILALAKQSAEQGIGDNDLKRLKRQFDSNKATYVNIDQKQRFMRGLHGLELNLERHTAIKDQLEQQQEKEAETLRALKAQNEQARANLTNTSASISQLYNLVDQATAATNKQLAVTTTLLQQHASNRAPVDTPLEPGPGQTEAQAMVEDETAEAKELERSIAAAEAELSDVGNKAAAGRQELAALRAEIARLELQASNVARAADADSHIKDAAQWCNDLLCLMSQLGGLSVMTADAEQLVLGILLRLPTSRQPGSPGTREIHHELTLQLLPQANAAANNGCMLTGARLSPEVPYLKAFLEATINGSDVSPAYIVSEVRRRLLSYWQRQVLVETAAEVYPPASSSRGPPHVKATLHHQVDVEVLVPWSWPTGSAPLHVTELNCPELASGAAEVIMNSINSNSRMLQSCDLLQLLQQVESVVEEKLVDAQVA